MMVFWFGEIVLQVSFFWCVVVSEFWDLFLRLFGVIKLLGFLGVGAICRFAFNTVIADAFGMIFVGRLCGVMVCFGFFLYEEWDIAIFIFVLVVFFGFGTRRYLVGVSVVFGFSVVGEVVVDDVGDVVVDVVVDDGDVRTCVVAVEQVLLVLAGGGGR